MTHAIITIDGTSVHEQRATERVVSRCATRRSAQILAATRALVAQGWEVRGPSSTDGFRRALLRQGERMGEPLDGTKCDERAQGFAARRGADVLVVDACAGLPLLEVEARGDLAEARETVLWYLGG